MTDNFSICHAYVNVGIESSELFNELVAEQPDPAAAYRKYSEYGWYSAWHMAKQEYNVFFCIRGVGYYTFIFHSETDLTKFVLRFSQHIESTRTGVDPDEDWQ